MITALLTVVAALSIPGLVMLAIAADRAPRRLQCVKIRVR